MPSRLWYPASGARTQYSITNDSSNSSLKLYGRYDPWGAGSGRGPVRTAPGGCPADLPFEKSLSDDGLKGFDGGPTPDGAPCHEMTVMEFVAMGWTG